MDRNITQGIKPVCFAQCMNAYLDCKYDRMHANLMCGEYIKAGWVSFELTELQSNQCDSPAGVSVFARTHTALSLLSVCGPLSPTLSNSQACVHAHG